MTEQTESITTTASETEEPTVQTGQSAEDKNSCPTDEPIGKSFQSAESTGESPQSKVVEDLRREAAEPGNHESGNTDDEPETFPAEYVHKLRDEAAQARVRAKDRDTLAQRLHEALVALDGRLVAPDELEYDEAHLEDPERLKAAIGALVKAKPYLAARRLRGDVGQGQAKASGDVNLVALMRGER